MQSLFKSQQRATPFHYSQFLQDLPPTIPPYDFGNPEITKGYAQQFVASSARIKALFGGNKSGKTHVNVYRQLTKIRNVPGCVTWAATKTYDMIAQTLWPKFQELIDDAEIKDISWANKKENKPSMIRWRNGSLTWFKTYEQGWETFQSADVHDILLDEECEKAIYKECLPRLLKYHGQLGISMTPLKGKTWPYFEIDQNNKAGMIESWRVSLFMNPFISQAEKDEIIELYGVDEIDRRVYGLFALLTGAVFKEFDEQVHILREEPRISPSWRRIRAVDLGYENPFCCLWIAQDDTGCLWVYDEYYQSHKLVRDHVPVIDSITQQHLQNVFHGNVQNYRPIECNLSDHEAQTRAELSAEGFHSRPAVKDIELGVQTVNRYLKPHAGKANLYISPRCRNLIRQMGTYHYKDVKEGKENKEVIDKVDDHAVDALRYGVMFFARPPRDYTVRQ